MSDPRKHHYVPAFYLRQWATNGFLCELRKIYGAGAGGECKRARTESSYAAGGAHDDASNADPRDVTSSDKLSRSNLRLICRSTS